MADANAEMLEQIDRYPRVRDRAIYWGEPDDLPDATFGADLPHIRDWAMDRFTFTGSRAGGAAARVADVLGGLL